MVVVAEGVENKLQLKFLQEQGIDAVQGYYYSHPLSVEECENILKNQSLKKISILELLNHQTETKEFQGEYPRVVAKFHRQLFFP